MFKLIFLFYFMFLVPQKSVAGMRKVPVAKSIYEKVETLVSFGHDLHEASYKRDKKEIAILIPKIIAHVEASKSIIVNDNVGAQHLLELLEAVSQRSAEAKSLKKQAQRDVFKFAFEKITRITQKYYVGNYRAFYCQKTQDLWIQRSWVVKNPVHPKSRCGKLVN